MTWSGLKERRNKHGWAEEWGHYFFIRLYSSLESINTFFGNLPLMHNGWKLPPISAFTPSLFCCCHCLMRMLQPVLHRRESLLILEAVTFLQPLLDASC